MGALAIMTEERCASVFDKNDGGVLLYDKNEDFCSFIILAFLLFHYLWGLRLEGTTACIALDDSSSHYALPLVLLDLITDHPTGASPLAKGRGSSTYELSSYFRVFKSGFSSKLRFDKNDGGVGFSKMGGLAIMTEERCASVFDKNDGGVGALIRMTE
jgi:hypothetical protein